MKKLATAIAVIAWIGTPAFAQAPPPAPVYNWTGWYVGGNLGVSLGTFKTDLNGAPLLLGAPLFTPFTPGFARPDDELYPAGFIGGGQAGFNWQLSPLWVVGAEADFQGADEKETNNFAQSFTFGPASADCGLGGTPCTAATGYSTQIEWFGTARLRAGYLFGDGAVLTYVTGGLAYGEVKINGTTTVSGTFSCGITGCVNMPFSNTQSFDRSHVNTGWVVGSGTEGKLLNFPGWTVKMEGLYMDLGRLDATSVTSNNSCTGCPLGLVVSGGQVTTHTHFTDTIIRLGVNYQFH